MNEYTESNNELQQLPKQTPETPLEKTPIKAPELKAFKINNCIVYLDKNKTILDKEDYATFHTWFKRLLPHYRISKYTMLDSTLMDIARLSLGLPVSENDVRICLARLGIEGAYFEDKSLCNYPISVTIRDVC